MMPLAALLMIPANLPAFELGSMKAADLKEVPGIALPEAPRAGARLFTPVLLNVSVDPVSGKASADDFSVPLRANVSRGADGAYAVGLRAGSDFDWADIKKTSDNSWELSSSGTLLLMKGDGKTYSLSGYVSDESRRVNVALGASRKAGTSSFVVNGLGLNMRYEAKSASGAYDYNFCSPKAVTAVTALVLAAQLDVPAAARPARQEDSLESAINKFIQTRCKSFEVLSADTRMTTHTVNWGIDDYIYTRNYSIRWNFDGAHPVQDYLTINVVNRWEGDWYVFGGESNDVCDFSNLEYYSR